jgi:hypothetical protein
MRRGRTVARRAALAISLVAGMLLAGCGSSSDERQPAAAESTTAATAPLQDAVTFRDPGGAYELDVDRDWTEILEQPKAWAIGSGSDGFGDNVNVIVERLAADQTLEEYLELSVRSAPRIIPGVDIGSYEFITLPSGERGGRWVYSGRPQDRDLEFLAVIGVAPGRAVTVTLTAEPERFATAVAAAEPYMRTLRLP